MEYTCLEQRLASGYLAMFPEFYPKENAEITAGEQRAFYDLMQRLFQLLFEEPGCIVPTLHPDDAFPTRYKKSYGKPELQAHVLKFEGAVKKLLKNLYLMGRDEEVKLDKRQRGVLSLVGIDGPAHLPAAWRWMCRRPDANPVAFAYCLFDEERAYTPEVCARLLGEEPYRKLERWLLAQGYRAFDTYNTEWPDFQLKLCYANPAWSDERPRGGNEYKIKHTGISVQYDAYVREPVSLGLCIPHGLKLFLENFDAMPPEVRDFVVERTKACDGCRYCVQTDRTGKRPVQCVPISHRGKAHRLCPYYPGYNYAWTRLDEPLIQNLTAMLAFMDGFSGRQGAAGSRKA